MHSLWKKSDNMDARRRFFSSLEQVGSSLHDRFESYKPRSRASSTGSKIPQRKQQGNAAIHKGSNSNMAQTNSGKPLYVGSSPAMSDDKYDMKHRSRGRVVIFVHEKFEDQKWRQGAKADVDNLQNCLPILGFKAEDISVHHDLTLSEITEKLSKLSAESYEDRDCLMVFVLTHGDLNDKIHARDQDYTVEKIWKPFIGEKCIGLTGKPKFFFIVACRGDKTDSGITVQRVRKMSTTTDATPHNNVSQTFSIPVNADMLTIFSTVQGYYSYREPDRGTWFVEALKAELHRLAETKSRINFTKLLECVNRRMCQKYETYNPEQGYIHEMKQCASYTSTLTRTVYMTLHKPK